jgi:hypothetical protein
MVPVCAQSTRTPERAGGAAGCLCGLDLCEASRALILEHSSPGCDTPAG